MKFMKRSLYIFWFAFLIAGCHDRIEEAGGGQGWLSVEFLTDKSVETRAGNEACYSLVIENQEGKQVYSCEDCASISERILLKAGVYRLVASSGKDVETGFDSPLYRAEQEINLQGGETKQVVLVCSQANVKVTVDYSDAVKRNFKEYSLLVENGKGSLAFEKEEKRAGYLRVNEGTLLWNLTLHNGQEELHLNKRIPGVKARQHYHFTFDIRESGDAEEGALVLGVVVDTTLDVYNWLCEVVLKDKFAEPEISRLDGGKLSDVYMVLDEARGADIALNVKAEAGMSDLTVTHHSEAVKALGVPEKFVLTNMAAEVKAAVNGAGIAWTPDDVSDKQEANIDFSALANRLPLGDYEFYVSVYDASCRLVNDTLRISVIPDIDHIADEVNVMDVWAKFATLRGRWYTLSRPEGMGLEYSKDKVNWTPATQVTFDESLKTFTAFVKDLEPATTYYVRSVADGGASETVRMFTTEGAEQVPYSNFDKWYLNGKAPMVGVDGEKVIWDSGNQGGASFGVIPTLEAKDGEAVSGSAVKMICKYVAGKFAAGSIYTGEFGGKDGLTEVKLNFGTPYECRPTSLSGYFKYTPGTINQTKSPYTHLNGKSDTCTIYVALCDWDAPFTARSKDLYYPNYATDPGVIAYGSFSTAETVTEYRKFTIKLDYRDTSRRPKYIVIVATASKYGDYFTGSENSVMYVDEFELGFDPVE